MYVDDIKLAGKKQNISPTWKRLMKDVDLGEPTSFLDHAYLGCTQRECQISKGILKSVMILWQTTEICSNHGFLPELWQNFQFPRNEMPIFPHGPMTWKVMQRNAWQDIANWRIKPRSNYAKSRRHAWMTISFREEENGSVGEFCPQSAHKLFWNVYLWLLLVDLIFYGLWTNLLVR